MGGALQSKKKKGNSMPDQRCGCAVDKCDIFDFMASHVGLTVIHPGGLKATAALAEALKIGPDSSDSPGVNTGLTSASPPARQKMS